MCVWIELEKSVRAGRLQSDRMPRPTAGVINPPASQFNCSGRVSKRHVRGETLHFILAKPRWKRERRGGSVWESNPPFCPRRTESMALKATRTTGPLAPPCLDYSVAGVRLQVSCELRKRAGSTFARV